MTKPDDPADRRYQVRLMKAKIRPDLTVAITSELLQDILEQHEKVVRVWVEGDCLMAEIKGPLIAQAKEGAVSLSAQPAPLAELAAIKALLHEVGGEGEDVLQLVRNYIKVASGWFNRWRDLETAVARQMIPMVLYCPFCFSQHLDEGEWATRQHRTHLCASCGEKFRPANVATVGVEELPPGA